MRWFEAGAGAGKLRLAAAQPRDALHAELWPVSLALRTLGALPIYTNRGTGEHTFRVLSPAFALSLLEYAAILAALTSMHLAEEAVGVGEFDRFVTLWFELLYNLLVVATPLCCWAEARALARHLNGWTRLQAEFEHVTGTQLRLGLRRRATLLLSVLFFGSCGLESWYSCQRNRGWKLGELAYAVFRDMLRGLLCVRWHLHCAAIVAVSKQALAQLQTEAAHLHGARVLQYRMLWLRLSAQTRAVGTACCVTHGFYLAYLLLTLMLAVYQALTNDLLPGEQQVSLTEGAVIGACVYCFCDSAHCATAHVGGEWQAWLLRVRHSPSRELRTQMGDFLETCAAHAPLVTLGDFVLVNRALLVAMTSTMITYLIVLVQFKMAAGVGVDVTKLTYNATPVAAS